jgi:ppGpp synthetase/RelA/SpoT-type nucleotidyltranferase
MTEGVSALNRQVGEVGREEEQEELFNFAEHRRTAVEEYLGVRPRYEAFAQAVREILFQALRAKDITVNSVEARAKEPESFGTKGEAPSENDPRVPKYWYPLEDITDLAGVRIITFFPRAVESVGTCIREEFEVLEHTDLSRTLLQEERFGYQSEHYLVRLSSKRTTLPEYNPHLGLVAEVQVRTILQHAWAEIEHDIQYKSSITIPNTIRRRFMALAGVFEIANREFQAIQDEDKQLRQEARTSVEEGVLDRVEITADALRSYLDRRVGSDARTNDFSYEYTARVLRRLGFTTIDQVDVCIQGYDDDQLSRILWLRRQGPLSRFEDMLLAGMGPVFVDRRTNDVGWKDALGSSLASLQEHGIPVRNYHPGAERRGESPD